jgi:hypothetical protein
MIGVSNRGWIGGSSGSAYRIKAARRVGTGAVAVGELALGGIARVSSSVCRGRRPCDATVLGENARKNREKCDKHSWQHSEYALSPQSWLKSEDSTTREERESGGVKRRKTENKRVSVMMKNKRAADTENEHACYHSAYHLSRCVICIS